MHQYYLVLFGFILLNSLIKSNLYSSYEYYIDVSKQYIIVFIISVGNFKILI